MLGINKFCSGFPRQLHVQFKIFIRCGISATKLPVSKSPQIATYASEKENNVSVQLLVILKGQEQLPKSSEVGNPCVSFLEGNNL